MSNKVDRDYKARDKHGCTDKVKHRSRASAEQEAIRLSISLGKRMHAYKCTYCRFNTFHVGTVIGSDSSRPPLVEKEKEVSVVKPNSPFAVLAPIAKAVEPEPKPEKSVKKKVYDPDSYPVSIFATDIIKQMDLYTSGKFPKPMGSIATLTAYGKHYGVLACKMSSAISTAGYLDACRMVGKTRIIEPLEFHNALIKFLEDKYPEAVKWKEDKIKERELKKKPEPQIIEIVKTNPNDILVASKLKDIVKLMNELIVLIEAPVTESKFGGPAP